MMDMETRDSIRAMERRLKDLERQLGKQPTRQPIAGGGGVGFRIYTADVYANLPNDVDGPAFGFTTGNQQLYVRRKYIGELAESWLIAGVFTTDARPSSIGERQGDLWWGRGAGPTEEAKYDGILFVYDTRQEDNWRPCSVLAMTAFIYTYQDAPIGTHAYGLSGDKTEYVLCESALGGKKFFPTTHLREPIG